MPPAPTKRTLVIAGAGIAGLTAAIALCKVGFRVIVMERAEARRTEGAGIQLSPNAFKILDDLGIGKMLRAAASFPAHIALHSAKSAQLLNRFELGDTARQRHGAPYAVIHRGDLTALLAAHCASFENIEIRYGEEVLDTATHANGVTVLSHVATVTTETSAKGLIIANGVWSTLSNLVPGRAIPAFSGQIAWRATALNDGTVPDGLAEDATHLWMAPHAHLVSYGMRMGREVNLVAVTPWQGQSEPTKGRTVSLDDRSIFDRHFSQWHGPIRDFVTDGALRWKGWPLFAAKAPKALHNGPIALIGDAAHAMLPYAAQGGAQAIEDALVLAACCAESYDDLAMAFKVYAAKRRKRVAQVMATARQNRQIYHFGRPMSFARDTVLRLTPQERLQQRMDWIYGWQTEANLSSNNNTTG
ncbi:MAG: FAD-dependent monooxygenase [Pseudomonadota bacterium]